MAGQIAWDTWSPLRQDAFEGLATDGFTMRTVTMQGICFPVTLTGLHRDCQLIVVRVVGYVALVVEVRLRRSRSLQGTQERRQKDDGRSGG